MFGHKSARQKDMLRFIELYRGEELLWNMSSSLYRRNDLKLKSYEKISRESRMPVEEVKKKIKSIRTTYCAEKAKVAKSMKSGCAADSIYEPSLHWYNEMSFLDTCLARRKTTDNSNADDNSIQVDDEPSQATTSQSEMGDCSFCESSFSDALPTPSKKRKHSPDINARLNDAIDNLVKINSEEAKADNTPSALEVFGKSVVSQLNLLPELDCFEAMAEIQTLLSKKISTHIKNKQLTQQPNATRTSTPMSQTSSSSNILFCAMSDADITDADFL